MGDFPQTEFSEKKTLVRLTPTQLPCFPPAHNWLLSDVMFTGPERAANNPGTVVSTSNFLYFNELEFRTTSAGILYVALPQNFIDLVAKDGEEEKFQATEGLTTMKWRRFETFDRIEGCLVFETPPRQVEILAPDGYRYVKIPLYLLHREDLSLLDKAKYTRFSEVGCLFSFIVDKTEEPYVFQIIGMRCRQTMPNQFTPQIIWRHKNYY